MNIIVTHEHADFDAAASLFAAAKLYPAATPYLPRRVNRNVHDFLTLYGDSLRYARLDDRPLHGLQRVIVVDTQAAPSLKGISRATGLHFIDHHPFGKDLPAGATHEGFAAGSTTTLLVSQLMQARTPVSPIEATLFMLGVYEDTGALTYGGTGLEDFRAATWLFEQGANLDIVHDFLHHPLTPLQRELYQSLLQSARFVEFAGHTVMIAPARVTHYVEEISTLAHHLRDLYDCDALFVLVQEDDSVQVVARSTSDAIDVGAIAGELGGGGHARAAAALMRGASLDSVERRLQHALGAHVRPMVTAGQIMSRSVSTLTPDMPMRDAEMLMKRYGHEGFPVVGANSEVLGLLTRREIDRAVQHGLGDQPVSAYMHKGAMTVGPDDTVERARAIMLSRGVGQVPVVVDGRLTGIITRTDLIKLWGRTQTPLPEIDVVRMLERALPDEVLILLKAAGSVAHKKQFSLYVVGGFVRDLLVSEPNFDIDLVVEGNAIALAKAMAKRFGGHVHIHARFGTAKWMLEGSSFSALASLDFITARREYYTHPTALPQVESSSIQQDLHRRDFTINTLAICLDEMRFGQLLDFFGGVGDLRAKLVRVLHNLSFVEDPTRILRAVRYEQRLGFVIEPRTAELISDALDLLPRVSGERLNNELFLIFAEAAPQKSLHRLSELSVLQAIHPELRADPALERLFAQVRAAWPDAPPVVYLGVLTRDLPLASAESIGRRLALSKSQEAFIAELNTLHREEARIAEVARPSGLVRLLEPFGDDALRAAELLSDQPAVCAAIRRYRAELRAVKPALTGDRLIALGMKRGPVFRDILEALRDARLDGAVTTTAEEERLAWQIWRRQGEAEDPMVQTR
ncbi:MAG: CBS domain-containing protein [Chloroflexi bacterium]|nr:CBS domain-containing protein [Chloroflexota bacterium]